jgi:uncharacterized protein
MTPDDLVQAAFEGNIERVKSLLAAGAGINALGRNWNPLHAAIENEQVEMVMFLLESGADVEFVCSGFRPLHHAIDVEADTAAQTNTALAPEPLLTKLLLDFGAEADARAADEQTPLEIAIARGHEKAAALLRLKMAG